jgi:hypothetical protein
MAKNDKNRQPAIPVLRWLVLLFLASGVSAFQQTYKQTYAITSVYAHRPITAQNARVSFFSKRHPSKQLIARRIPGFKILNLLSQKTSTFTSLVLRRCMITKHYLAQNILLHFLNGTCTPHAPDGDFIFIS